MVSNLRKQSTELQIGHTVRKFKNKDEGTPMAVQGYDSVFPMQGVQVRSLFGELRSHMLWGHGQKINFFFKVKILAFIILDLEK